MLDPREQMAFKANLWRWKTILLRNKKRMLKVYMTTIIYSIVLIALNILLKPQNSDLQATSSIQVSGSNPLNQSNYWSDFSQNITSNFNFSDCSSSPEIFNSIGYVMSSSASAQE